MPDRAGTTCQRVWWRWVCVGDRWTDCNPRGERIVTVEKVDADHFGNGFVYVRGVRRSRIRAGRFTKVYRLHEKGCRDPGHDHLHREAREGLVEFNGS